MGSTRDQNGDAAAGGSPAASAHGPGTRGHVVLDPATVEGRRGTAYPPPFDRGFEGRVKRRLTAPLGLTQFGVNLVTLEPGAYSSQRHWHAKEDEFVYVVRGPVTLVTDAGETVLETGWVAAFPAGVPDGHHLTNRGPHPVTYLEIGTRAPDEVAEYPDIDLRAVKESGTFRFTTKADKPLPE
ncbi:MAG: cupin domain-containing protein [Deltaproteobacteria bacterium]|nr:MAG: cupin domain-containing protein [Deltaproteobacteria bacterium]